MAGRGEESEDLHRLVSVRFGDPERDGGCGIRRVQVRDKNYGRRQYPSFVDFRQAPREDPPRQESLEALRKAHIHNLQKVA